MNPEDVLRELIAWNKENPAGENDKIPASAKLDVIVEHAELVLAAIVENGERRVGR